LIHQIQAQVQIIIEGLPVKLNQVKHLFLLIYPVGATARSQAVLDELEKNGYIKVVAKKLFGGKTYDITDKGRNAIG
jgi:predicted transcriptional regulator